MLTFSLSTYSEWSTKYQNKQNKTQIKRLQSVPGVTQKKVKVINTQAFSFSFHFGGKKNAPLDGLPFSIVNLVNQNLKGMCYPNNKTINRKKLISICIAHLVQSI